MRLLIGHVGDGAYDNKRDVEIVADMGDCRRFHLYSNGLWEVVADFRQTNRTVDESVAANNQATYSVKIQFGNAGLSGSDQFIVSFKPAGQPGN